MQVGFHSGRRHHTQLEVEESSEDSWSLKDILSFVGNDKDIIREHPIPQLKQEAEKSTGKSLGVRARH